MAVSVLVYRGQLNTEVVIVMITVAEGDLQSLMDFVKGEGYWGGEQSLNHRIKGSMKRIHNEVVRRRWSPDSSKNSIRTVHGGRFGMLTHLLTII